MKKILLGAVLALGTPAFAQNADNNNTPSNRNFTANPRNGSDAAASARPSDDDKYVESDVVPLAGKQGFSFSTRAGDFLFKPYALIQASGNFNYYDDENLNLAEVDRVANSGFAIPNAIIGFSGKAFNKITFNFALNAAKSGGELLQQAWFDVNFSEAVRFRAGKFKTPFQTGYLTTLGQTMFPQLPSSMTTPVRTNLSLDAVQPSIYTGFDLGVQLHGVVKNRVGYQVGVFNGTGIGVNTATKGTSDDHRGLPSLLYAGRLAYMPKGVMPTHQGDPDDLRNDKLLFALSGSVNVEGNSESSNDFRAGLEFAWLKNRWYVSAEGYLLRMNWTKRMMREGGFTSWGAYGQLGYFATKKLQLAARYDFFDRNGTELAGFLNMPAVGFNYFFARTNLKLQAMYQYIGKWGHDTQLERDNDDMGMAYHSATVMLQYTF